MSVLASLVRVHERLSSQGLMPEFGFANQNIQFFLELKQDGQVDGGLQAFAYDEKARLQSRSLAVPYFGGRSGKKPPPYFLWDNTAYVLGVSGKQSFDARPRFDAFRDLHLATLSDSDDIGLRSVCRFLERWEPDLFAELGFPEDALDRNVVFRLSGEHRFVHEREAAVELWRKLYKPDSLSDGICLISGERAPIARIHPPIKSFDNPARIVSFDKDNDAFSSYGHVQAENAPTSVVASFEYTAVLNHFLTRGSGHRVQIGDASTVFWADAERERAEAAEELFFGMVDPESVAAAATKALAAQLERIRKGAHLEQVAPDLGDVRFHVLGLAPNAARLSIRFHWQDSFGVLTRNYQRFVEEITVEPAPPQGFPSYFRYLAELGTQNKLDNVPPNLPGAWMRAILDGLPYPMTLLSTALMRIRADGRINALRAGMMRAVLIRNLRKEAPVALDPEFTKSKGYVLGRLFAVHEEIQRSALGGSINATIRDKFYGAASATPQKVFGLLFSGSANHLQKLRKQSPGRAVNLEKLVQSITDLAEPGETPFPASLSAEEQAMFGLGYYHQHSAFFQKKETVIEEAE